MAQPPPFDPAAQDIDSFHHWPGMEQSTAQGAKRIFRRFILIAVGLNVLVGAAVVTIDVADSIWATRDYLRATGQLLTRAAMRMRQSPLERDEDVVRRAAEVTGFPMALLSRNGEVRYSSDPQLPKALRQVYDDHRPTIGARFAIRSRLGDLSGAWIVAPYTERHDLLVVVTRKPEDAGLVEYMTVAAGLTGLGIALSFVIMLVAANWMLRRPLARLVQQLTSALATDVHRRKQAEERAVSARLEAEEHLAFIENLIDASQAVGLAATDAAGRIRIFNRAAEGILGYAAAEVVGRLSLEQLERLCAAAPREPRRAPLLHATAGESFLRDKGGVDHLLDLKRSDIVDGDGKKRGELLLFVDVTERRRLEAELQLNELQLLQSAKMATLGEMATGVAHELNQPLNNIGLLTTRMTRKLGGLGLDAASAEFYADKLHKVQAQVERAGKIIDHLRTFGRVRQAKLSRVRPHVPVEGVLVFLGEQLQAQSITVEVEVPTALPEVVADEAQLEQVLLNLLVNARDALVGHTPPPGTTKRIVIRAARDGAFADGVPAVALRVSDNGPGMMADVLERIFDPFFTTKEVGQGTGLGLSISYGLVRDFGGELGVESSAERGSTFSVRLREAQREPEP